MAKTKIYTDTEKFGSKVTVAHLAANSFRLLVCAWADGDENGRY